MTTYDKISYFGFNFNQKSTSIDLDVEIYSEFDF